MTFPRRRQAEKALLLLLLRLRSDSIHRPFLLPRSLLRWPCISFSHALLSLLWIVQSDDVPGTPSSCSPLLDFPDRTGPFIYPPTPPSPVTTPPVKLFPSLLDSVLCKLVTFAPRSSLNLVRRSIAGRTAHAIPGPLRCTLSPANSTHYILWLSVVCFVCCSVFSFRLA